MTMQIRLDCDNINLTNAEYLKHYFDAELFTKHQTARLYPSIELEEVIARIKAYEGKLGFTLTYISNDLKQYGYEEYIGNVKQDLNRELDIADMYKIKEEFSMGSYFEGIADADEMFMPALAAGFEEAAGQFGLGCTLVDIKGHTIRFTNSENEHEICVTYSPTYKAILVEMNGKQIPSNKINVSDGYEALYNFIEEEIINEEFFPDL